MAPRAVHSSGRSKGFGFVEMATPTGVAEAIEALHGSIHKRRAITVSEANLPDASTAGARATAGRVREVPDDK